ncbi:hypothetical protein AMK68_00160 [candidate division KD3-62 bacterium DG_56]|uniref:Uncharacterized protein n=1 Tax=candidate division KD3-62 bacterium DG_56 TaxID=1704032 RepID=A0A0S7XQV0_9BACT|nr:MAG: hypothetical protein AMK68_00160 [candidate division KD3-62 bacterium DG_56]
MRPSPGSAHPTAPCPQRRTARRNSRPPRRTPPASPCRRCRAAHRPARSPTGSAWHPASRRPCRRPSEESASSGPVLPRRARGPRADGTPSTARAHAVCLPAPCRLCRLA